MPTPPHLSLRQITILIFLFALLVTTPALCLQAPSAQIDGAIPPIRTLSE